MKLDRLISILTILLDKKRVGAQELAERFEVSPRTIYRDLDAINRAGIPVRSAPGVGGGFEIMPGYKLDKTVFSSADLSALLMGLSSLSNMVRGDELVHALAKVKSFLPAESAEAIESRANQIHIDSSPWMGSSVRPCLELIQGALRENKLVAFAYLAHHGKKTERTVEPYQLVLKSGHWYLQGYCRERDDFRLFRLSRMSGLRQSGESFSPRAFQPPVLDFAGMLEPMQTEIKLRIHHSILDRVLEYCAYEHVLPDGDEHYLVRFPFVENGYHYDILFSFGDRCECLEPPHVRAEIKRRIRALAAVYGGCAEEG